MLRRLNSLFWVLFLLSAVVASTAAAQTLNTLYVFTGGTDGANPMGRLVADKAGNLYGIARNGGMIGNLCPEGCGTVFELSPSGSAWTFQVIYSFTGANGDGMNPWGLTIDAKGNLFGVTTWGGNSDISVCGANSCGTVFELSHGANGWSEKIIYDFQGGTADGALPFTNIAIDGAGNLYGTALWGGTGTQGCYGNGCGVVWELSPTASGQWKSKIIHNFLGRSNGMSPWGLTLTAAGDIYGATNFGGNAQRGTVYKLSKGKFGWVGGVIYRLSANPILGYLPQGPVGVDAAGNVLVAAMSPNATVFELTPSSNGYQEQTIVSFPQNAPSPLDGIFMDSAGNIYGSTDTSVFQLSMTSGTYGLSTIATFQGSNMPADPSGAVLVDSQGNLFGTAEGGLGTAKNGAIWELTP